MPRRRRNPPSIPVGIKLPADLLARVRAEARARGTSLAALVRESLLRELASDRAMARGTEVRGEGDGT